MSLTQILTNQFSNNEFTGHKSTRLPKKGESVLTVRATDDDEGLNAKLTYAIEQSQQDFKIDPNTGKITVLRSLDRETTPTYRFDVSATDHGSPRLKGKASVHIKVTDVK